MNRVKIQTGLKLLTLKNNFSLILIIIDILNKKIFSNFCHQLSYTTWKNYLSIVKPDSNPLNQIFKIPSSRHIINTNINNINHPEGNIKFSNNQSFYLDFYECHNLGCKPPAEIIDVYMTSNSISDKQILRNSLNDKEKIVFVNSSELSFHPTRPNVNDENSNNLFNKLIIHTKQRENIEAFYIYNVNLTQIN